MKRNGWLLVAVFMIVGRAEAQTNDESSRLRAISNRFEVRSVESGPEATKVIELCEILRGELQRVWAGGEMDSKWEPRCQVVLHNSRASYLTVVGPGGAQTSGCSLIEFDERTAGKIVTRRLDLLIDKRGALPALPHELTHVVLADRFRGRQPPHWLNEGIAMLADNHDKQSLHQRDCHDALRSGQALPISEILHLQQFSSAQQMPAFYGQSLSLVRMLSERDRPQIIVEFAIDALDQGFDRALKRHYALNSVAELEREWRSYALSGMTRRASPPIIAASFQP